MNKPKSVWIDLNSRISVMDNINFKENTQFKAYENKRPGLIEFVLRGNDATNNGNERRGTTKKLSKVAQGAKKKTQKND